MGRMQGTRSRVAQIATFTLIGVVLLLAALILLPPRSPWTMRLDPALQRADPSELRGDAWDRRAAWILASTRDLPLGSLLQDAPHDLEVVTRLLETHHDAGEGEWRARRVPGGAHEVMLLRRPRAAYVVAERALRSEDARDRAWGLEAVELHEGRCGLRGYGQELHGPGVPYEGPERDRALAAVGALALHDPDPELRGRALFVIGDLFPTAGIPPTDALLAALATETDPDNRWRLLHVLSDREVDPAVLVRACLQGFEDPRTIAGVLDDLLVEGNLALLEDAFARGDATCRAGVGMAFYYDQSPKPWAEALILRGLADPARVVREGFAKGAVVLKPPTPAVRAALIALCDETECAAWALRILDGDTDHAPCGGDGEGR